MSRFSFFILLIWLCSIEICCSQRFDTTSDCIFAKYNKDKPTITDERNVMRLTCVIDDNKVITEYQLAIAYNSANKSIISKGQEMTLLLYNNKTLTFHSLNDITAEDNISYKERVKIRNKCYLIYRISLEEMNEILRYGVFELKMSVGRGKFCRYSVRNVAVWQFNEVLKIQFEELQKNQKYYVPEQQTASKSGKKSDKKTQTETSPKSNAKPDTDVNLLYKEGGISYLEGDSLVKTDKNISFDIKWIE